VRIGDKLAMFDCGPATTHKLVKAGLWPTDVSHLFFSHHHYDHDVDYPCFLLCRWDQNVAQRDNPLSVYGPTLTEELTRNLVGENGAFAHDIRARINWTSSQRTFVNRGGTLPRLWPEIDAHDVDAGWQQETDNFRVNSALAVHAQPYLDSLAWRIDTDECGIVFTGDTEPCDSVRQLAEGADVLVSMCWDHQERMESECEDAGQMGTLGAGRLADEAGVKNLVLVHSGPAVMGSGSRERAIGDIREVYHGSVWVGEELLSLDFDRKSHYT
jgi:ribonuclease BN (tRNA processing enzyme)